MVKRLTDFIFSLVAAVLFFPIGLFIAIVLRLTGEGEIFYSQERFGRKGETFKLLKFATMLKNSPNIGTGDITTANDPRVLPVGKFLRKAKLNEVPQILNILSGQMSLVGPRPLTLRNFECYPEEDQSIISSMRPGLTGIGSIVFRDEEQIVGNSVKSPEQCYKEDIAPYKAALEKWYYTHKRFTTDILIVAVTAWVVLVPHSKIYLRIWKDLPAAPNGVFPEP